MGIDFKTKEDAAKVVIFNFFAVLVVSIFAGALRGVVLSYLWGWFLVPLGMPPIGIMMALGVSLLVTFLTYHHLSVKQDLHPLKTRLSMSIFYPAMVFLVGYIYHIYS